jgi:hypothetical protein
MVLNVERTIEIVTGGVVDPPEPQNISRGITSARKALVMLDHP